MATLSYDDAAHLLRRAGFGGNPDQINALTTRDRDGAADFLINYQQIDNSSLDNLLSSSFDLTDPSDNQKFNQAEIRRWWFTRIILTNRQFEEKMTLFWHNHFATSLSKVQDFYMFNQNKLLRDNALARFDDLLLKVAQDPAMLIWLDNVTNVLGHPNENFGRELQELFSMGITDVVTGAANYSEDDVKQIARAFTGWNFRRTPAGGPLDFQFQLRPNQHDNGAKTIYAGTPWQTSGQLDGGDVITVICNRPATARYLTWKLFNFFVYPVTTSSTDKSTIDRFAQTYLSNNHSIKELMRAILTSDEFYSDRARFSLVKQPVEFIAGAIRMLGAVYNPGAIGRTSNAPANFSRNQGQDIFFPPDVAGWDLNLGWINTATMLERYNYTNTLVNGRSTTTPGISLSLDQLKLYTKSSTKKTIKKFFEVLGPLSPGSGVRKKLQTYLTTADNGQPVDFTPDDATIDKKVRGLAHQVMCLPEFELN
ncbi:MAG TPA: DUF1800 domain-containing protein [Blastocatellia bacterium]|nr:DUF1800 domain-containing protein [Blastocatellia bacterium]